MNIYNHQNLFIENKYTIWYYRIINNALLQNRRKNNDVYFELHHILPKSLFPQFNKEKWNLVLLTAREHFICHLLLTKMTNHPKMILALSKMMSSSKNQKRYEINSYHYEKIRTLVSKLYTGQNNPMFGKNHSEETRRRISNSVIAKQKEKGPRILTQEVKDKIGKSNIGKIKPVWLRKQWSEVRKGRPGQDNNSGKHWYNDGIKSYLSKNCPEGCVPGRLKVYS